MNKNLPITKPIHPKFIIQYVVSSVVRELYDINWQPRVVKQKSRHIPESGLRFLDYAVPCFELTQHVELTPPEITKQIVEKLADRLQMEPSTEYFQFLTFEAVSGYINFQLEDTYIADCARLTSHWIAQPDLLFEIDPTMVLVLDGGVRSEELSRLTSKVLKHISEIRSLLKLNISFQYILNDRSEGALPKIAELIEGKTMESDNNASVGNMRALRRLKQVIAESPIDLGLHDASELQNKLELTDAVLGSLGVINNLNVVAESASTSMVNDYLDGLQGSGALLAEKLVYDEANKAVYYLNNEDVIPLRSANGYLYGAAFQMYVFSNCLKTNKSRLLVVAPQLMHSLLQQWADLISPEHAGLVLFDPMVSAADIHELDDYLNDVTQLTRSARYQLAEVSLTTLDDKHIRQDVLTLIDFPMDLMTYINDLQIPALFDLLNLVGRTVGD